MVRYEVITTPTDVIMVMEYAGEELFNYIVQKGKGGVGPPSFKVPSHTVGVLATCKG